MVPANGGTAESVIDTLSYHRFTTFQVDGPSTLVMSGSEDTLISPETMFEFQKLMQSAEVRCDVEIYEGAAHGFFNQGRDEDKFYKLTRDRMDAYLVSLHWLVPNP